MPHVLHRRWELPLEPNTVEHEKVCKFPDSRRRLRHIWLLAAIAYHKSWPPKTPLRVFQPAVLGEHFIRRVRPVSVEANTVPEAHCMLEDRPWLRGHDPERGATQHLFESQSQNSTTTSRPTLELVLVKQREAGFAPHNARDLIAQMNMLPLHASNITSAQPQHKLMLHRRWELDVAERQHLSLRTVARALSGGLAPVRSGPATPRACGT